MFLDVDQLVALWTHPLVPAVTSAAWRFSTSSKQAEQDVSGLKHVQQTNLVGGF